MQYQLTCERSTERTVDLIARFMESIDNGPRPCDAGVTIIDREAGVIDAPANYQVKGFGRLEAEPAS